MLNRLLENWPYKLVAVIIAIVLRGYVSAQMNPHKVVTVPLTIVHVPDGFEKRDATDNVELEITGSSTALDGLRQSDITATVDAAAGHAGLNRGLPIVVSVIPELQTQIQIESKTPTTASLNLDQISTTRRQVHINFTHTPPPGYAYGVPVITPAVATISAPASIIGSIRDVVADVDAGVGDTASAVPEQIDGKFDVFARDDEDHRISSATVSPLTVRVTIPIMRATSVKTVPIGPMVVGRPADGYIIAGASSDPPLATISGTSDVLDKVNVIMTSAVDVTGATDDVRKSASLGEPAGVTIGTMHDVVVDIKIVRASTTNASPPTQH